MSASGNTQTFTIKGVGDFEFTRLAYDDGEAVLVRLGNVLAPAVPRGSMGLESLQAEALPLIAGAILDCVSRLRIEDIRWLRGELIVKGAMRVRVAGSAEWQPLDIGKHHVLFHGRYAEGLALLKECLTVQFADFFPGLSAVVGLSLDWRKAP